LYSLQVPNAEAERKAGRQTDRQTDNSGERRADWSDCQAFRRGLLPLDALLDVLSEASDPRFLPSRGASGSGGAGLDLTSLEIGGCFTEGGDIT